MSDNVRPLSTKWLGASIWVPVCDPISMEVTLTVWLLSRESFVCVDSLSGGSDGQTGMPVRMGTVTS
jgi:hypothetical protein